MNETNLHAKGGNVIAFTSDLKNPNRMPFSGVLTYLGTPSDQPPGGSGGLKVLIPVDVGQAALDSLIGMPVNLSASLDDHDTDNVIGVIEDAWIGEVTAKGTPVHISGHIFAKSFPDEADTIKRKQSALGFSYETSKTSLQAGEYKGEQVAVASSLVFTGCAILYKLSAAYKSTSLAAKAAALNQEVTELKVEGNAQVENTEEVVEAQTEATEVQASEEAPEATETQVEAAAEETAEETVEVVAAEEAPEATEEVAEVQAGADLATAIAALTQMVSEMKSEIADLKAAQAAPAAEVEAAAEETQEIEAAGQEPQRRSSETLVTKFGSNEQDGGDIFASIDKQNLNPVDSMAKKFAALFN